LSFASALFQLFVVVYARVAPMGAPRRAQPCEHGGGNRRQDPRASDKARVGKLATGPACRDLVNMRIDLTLKYLCLVKSRSIAKTLCERRSILVDGKYVRPAAAVKVSARITIHFASSTKTIELLIVPEKQLSKSAAVDYYQLIDTPREEAHPGDEDGFFDRD
jgi:ribosomal 50S subunit-recycling heat shock protein